MSTLRTFLHQRPALLALAHRLLGWWYAACEWRDRLPGARLRHARTPYGFTLFGRNDAFSRRMLRGTYEVAETECMQRYLGDVDVVVDVGANIGFFTCLARSAGKHVIAIEPQARNLECLHQSLAANGWTDGVEVVAAGLGRERGRATLYGASNLKASLVPGFAGVTPATTQAIALRTLDEILEGRFSHQRLLIKVDVEGAEYEVLLGAPATLARRPPPVWLVEICGEGYHPGGTNPTFVQTFEMFRNHGYEASPVGSDADGHVVTYVLEAKTASS